MRISDWSSDVCSSDLSPAASRPRRRPRPSLSRRGPSSPRDHSAVSRDWWPRGQASGKEHWAWKHLYGAKGGGPQACGPPAAADQLFRRVHTLRSEEHTSELQSLMRISYAVFCLNKKINSTKKADNVTPISTRPTHTTS